MDLKDFEQRLAELKTALDTATEKKVKEAIEKEIKELEAKIPDLKDVKDELKKVTDWQVKKDEADKKNQEALDKLIADGDKRKGPEQKQSFESAMQKAIEEKTDEISKMARGEKHVKHIEMTLKAVGDITTANVTGSTVWGAQVRPGIIENVRRKVHMRQVMPMGRVGAGTDYYFMKETGAGEGAPAFTAEGSSKPQVDVDLVESSVKIESLPCFARVTRKAMNNIPGFTSFLQNRMLERLLRAEDAGILYGTGVTPEIKGLLVSGNYTASVSAATILAEKIIDDIAALEDTHERSANIVLMRPQQYYGFFKNKASGSGEYDLPSNVQIINGQLFISGVACYATTALNINTVPTPDTTDYLVADTTGFDFLVQEDLRLEIFEQDADNVTKNKITVRLEETVALPVYGSNYVIYGTQNIAI